MSDQPTQVRNPWRTAFRTAFQVTLALASLIPVAAAAGGLETKAGVAQVIGVCVIVTRIMAMPAVDEFLRRFMPWLAAESQPAVRR